MIDILILLILNSFYCIGFKLSTEDGMILSNINKLENHIGYYWYKPIAGCITCMASLHSYPYLLMFGFDWIYIIYVFALAGLNTWLYNVGISE